MARSYTEQGLVSEILTVTLEEHYPNLTCGVSFYPDGDFDVPLTAGVTGSYTAEGIVNGNATYTEFNNSPVDASVAGLFSSINTPMTKARVVPNAIVGATHWRVIFTGTGN